LHHPTAGYSTALDQTVITVFFAVFLGHLEKSVLAGG
jgi:hypothetical protein